MKAPQDIILKPIMTERSMDGINHKRYTFVVARDSNKIEIAKAVEELFPSTTVNKVNTMNCKGHYIRQGKTGGYRPNWKKAIVTLSSDSKPIEFFEGMI